MHFHYPYRGWRWVRDVENFDIFANKHKKIGYILEVDLNIPQNLHTFFQDLPPILTQEEFGNRLANLLALYTQKKVRHTRRPVEI